MRLFILPLVLLAACSVPHPLSGFTHQATKEVAGFTFDIRWNDRRAQATRTNFYLSRDMTPVWDAAEVAVRKASGCAVRKNSLKGDIALVTMDLACDGSEDTAPPPRKAMACSGFASELLAGSGDFMVDFLCGPE